MLTAEGFQELHVGSSLKGGSTQHRKQVFAEAKTEKL
jgi:hypothetical protein